MTKIERLLNGLYLKQRIQNDEYDIYHLCDEWGVEKTTYRLKIGIEYSSWQKDKSVQRVTELRLALQKLPVYTPNKQTQLHLSILSSLGLA